MNSPTWADDDDQLMAEVKGALAEDDIVIDRMRQAALEAFSWRNIDLELERLTLSFDSDFDEVSAVRGSAGGTSRMMTFIGPSVSLELEIDDETIVGQLFPVQAGLVTLLTAAGSAGETRTDDVGWFSIPRPAAGSYRLRCDATTATVVTEWLT